MKKNKLISGFFWSSIDVISLHVFRILVTIVLARILNPSDFGLLAIISIFIVISDVLIDSGFTQTLISKQNNDNETHSTIFYFNLLISFLIYLAIFLSSDFIATYYNQLVLSSLIKVFSITIIINAFSLIPNVIATKALNFRVLAKINITSTFFGGIISILLAIFGFGVWSLVYQILSKSIIRFCLFIIYLRWRPLIVFDFKKLKENLNFSYKLTIAQLINVIYDNIYNVLIGKAYNSEVLGYFYQARNLSNMPTSIFSSIFYKVTFPIMSSIKEDEIKLRVAFLRFNKLSYFIMLPIMILLYVIAPTVIKVILSEKWLNSIEFFQILVLTGFFYISVLVTGLITIIKERSEIYLYAEIFYKVISFLILIITFNIGLKAMVWGINITITMTWLINSIISSKLLKLNYFLLFQVFLESLIIPLIVGIVTFSIQYLIQNQILLLITQTVTFIIFWLSLNLLFKIKEMNDIKDLFITKLNIKLR